MGYSKNHTHDIKALNRKLFELSKARPGDAPVSGLVKFIQRINPQLHVKMVVPSVRQAVRYSTYNELNFTPAQQAEFDSMYGMQSTRTITAKMEEWRKAGALATDPGYIDAYSWERTQVTDLPGVDKMPHETVRAADKVEKITKSHAADLQLIMNELAREQQERQWCEVFEDSVAALNGVCLAQLPKPIVKHVVSVGMSFKFELPGKEDLTYRNRGEKQQELRSALQEEMNAATSLDDAIAILQKYNATENADGRYTEVQTSGLLRQPVLG